MSPQFTTSDVKDVVEETEETEYINQASQTGGQIVAIMKQPWTETGRFVNFHGLMADHGWYITGAIWFDGGHMLFLAPAKQEADDD